MGNEIAPRTVVDTSGVLPIVLRGNPIPVSRAYNAPQWPADLPTSRRSSLYGF